MKAHVELSTTVRTIVIRVEGALDLADPTATWRAKPRWFQPNKATIYIEDGVTKRIKVSGFLVLKSGHLSSTVTDKAIYTATGHDYGAARITDAPGWVQLLWREAPAGVMRWTDAGAMA